MIQKIINWSLNNRWAVVACSVLLMAVGYLCFKFMRIEAYPDIADTNVIVISTYEGRAAEEVEQQVTIPVERALNNVPKVISRRSRTIFGLSVVQLNFQDGVDDYFARQQVKEKLSSADLPPGVNPELGPLTSAVGEIFRYVVEAAPTYTPMQLRDLQDYTIRPFLLQVPGIADIITFGGPVKQFHIATSPEKLRKYGLSLREVMDAVEANNINTGGNIVERGGQGFAVRGIGALKSTEDISNIVISNIKGSPIYLKDLASIEINPPQPQGILGYAIPDQEVDINSGVEGIISIRRGENPTEILELVQAKIDELQTKELPEGVKLKVIYSRKTLIDYTLTTVSHTLFEGLSIVLILLILFFGNIRAAIVVLVTIPFSLLFAFIIMKLTGIPANLLSLGAIDFGIIVDGACVMAAHLMHEYKIANAEQRKAGIISTTIHSANEVGREIFFSVMIIILAYLPILTMQRVEGKLFSPMALTLSFAVLGSMLCSLTLIPVLISFVFDKKFVQELAHKPRKFDFFKSLEDLYDRFLNKILVNYKKVTLASFIILAVLISFGLKLGTEFLPTLDEGSIFMRSFLPSGTNITENQKIAPIIRKVASQHPQIEAIITQSGRNDDGTDPFPSNRTEVLMILKDYGGWVNDTSKQELIDNIKQDIRREIPGAALSFGQPIIDQVAEIVNGSAADLAINIIGDDLEMMRGKADSIATLVRNTEGAVETGIEQEGMQDQLIIKIDRKKAARYGINVADMQIMIEAAIGGKNIGNIYEGVKKYDIIVRFYPENRNNIDVIKTLQVPAPNGASIPLHLLADIYFSPGQTNIYRADSKRLLTIRTNIKGRDQGGFVREVQEKISNQIKLPQGYFITYGGQFENLERASKQLAIAIPLTIIIVLLVLYALFHHVRHALIVLSCVLFALSGGIVALLLRGYNFNVSAGVGFVSLFGISVMAGVLIVSAINRLKEKSKDDFATIVRVASVSQIKSVLMMLLVAIIGLIPAATSSGIGSDVQRPLATVIIGGLLTTLLFTPFSLPPLFLWIEKHRKQKN